jgi:hypothetical protein
LIEAVAWFAAESGGVHGITQRDLAAMKLLAVWCALGLLTRDWLDVRHYRTLTAPFYGLGRERRRPARTAP